MVAVLQIDGHDFPFDRDQLVVQRHALRDRGARPHLDLADEGIVAIGRDAVAVTAGRQAEAGQRLVRIAEVSLAVAVGHHGAGEGRRGLALERDGGVAHARKRRRGVVRGAGRGVGGVHQAGVEVEHLEERGAFHAGSHRGVDGDGNRRVVRRLHAEHEVVVRERHARGRLKVHAHGAPLADRQRALVGRHRERDPRGRRSERVAGALLERKAHVVERDEAEVGERNRFHHRPAGIHAGVEHRGGKSEHRRRGDQLVGNRNQPPAGRAAFVRADLEPEGPGGGCGVVGREGEADGRGCAGAKVQGRVGRHRHTGQERGGRLLVGRVVFEAQRGGGSARDGRGGQVHAEGIVARQPEHGGLRGHAHAVDDEGGLHHAGVELGVRGIHRVAARLAGERTEGPRPGAGRVGGNDRGALEPIEEQADPHGHAGHGRAAGARLGAAGDDDGIGTVGLRGKRREHTGVVGNLRERDRRATARAGQFNRLGLAEAVIHAVGLHLGGKPRRGRGRHRDGERAGSVGGPAGHADHAGAVGEGEHIRAEGELHGCGGEHVVLGVEQPEAELVGGLRAVGARGDDLDGFGRGIGQLDLERAVAVAHKGAGEHL